MDRGRVGEDRGSKEMDGCPLTLSSSFDPSKYRSKTSDKLIPSTSLRAIGSMLAGDDEQVKSDTGTNDCATSTGSTDGAVV
jgi:hypothetical protein